MKNLESIMKELDKWVSVHGDVSYDMDYEYTPYYRNAEPMPGIQQNRTEIKEFVKLILDKGFDKTILELGLGYYGSTHFLWRMLFDKSITIEKDNDRIKDFGTYTMNYYDSWILNDGKSFFVHGNTVDSSTVESVYRLIEKEEVDVLFIDAEHTYGSVLRDWLLYSKKVKVGGIVAFHDILLDYPFNGVKEFVHDLQLGRIDGKEYKVNRIISSKNRGIGWYEVE
jgi:cephalosporin hydroxylase